MRYRIMDTFFGQIENDVASQFRLTNTLLVDMITILLPTDGWYFHMSEGEGSIRFKIRARGGFRELHIFSRAYYHTASIYSIKVALRWLYDL